MISDMRLSLIPHASSRSLCGLLNGENDIAWFSGEGYKTSRVSLCFAVSLSLYLSVSQSICLSVSL